MKKASKLCVWVSEGGETRVKLWFPANSARWLCSLIPEHVLPKIRERGIDLLAIERSLASQEDLQVGSLLEWNDGSKVTKVWLE